MILHAWRRLPQAIRSKPACSRKSTAALSVGSMLCRLRISQESSATSCRDWTTHIGGPPYNLSLQDRPFLRPRKGYWKTIEEDFHWHLEILPQLIGLTGFERASWFSYNPVPPETAARCLSG